MSQTTPNELGRDHKHWLAEIERWQGYLRIWSQQQASLAKDVERVIEAHGQQLRQHAKALEDLQHTIADCERALGGGTHSAATLQTQHEMDSCLHDQQRAAHEQLKATHHRLMLAIAMMKGEPFREE